MPQMGVSVAEGTITDWVKRPGDWVEADEIVCIVTTDKVDVEIPAPASGRLERVLVEVDQTVPVGTPLPRSIRRRSPVRPIRRRNRARPARRPNRPRIRPRRRSDPPPRISGPRSPRGPPPRMSDSAEPERSGFYSPVVRRIADKHGIDLSLAEGTGIGGRVRKRDVLAYIDAGGEHEAEPAVAEPAPETGERLASHRVAVPARGAGPGDGQRRTRARGDLAATARHPRTGATRADDADAQADRGAHGGEPATAAHCTTIVEVDMSSVAARRRQLKEAMARRDVPLTYLAFVARATVEALQRHPILNARLDGDQIVYQEEINLGIAVALEQGLIVPVIRQAQRLSLEGWPLGSPTPPSAPARAARPRRRPRGDVHDHQPRPVRGGAGDLIINQPQVGILDLEAIVKRLMWSSSGTARTRSRSGQ